MHQTIQLPISIQILLPYTKIIKSSTYLFTKYAYITLQFQNRMQTKTKLRSKSCIFNTPLFEQAVFDLARCFR